MVRKIIGDRAADYLSQFGWLLRTYVAYRKILERAVSAILRETPYRRWRRLHRKRFKLPVPLEDKVDLVVLVDDMAKFEANQLSQYHSQFSQVYVLSPQAADGSSCPDGWIHKLADKGYANELKNLKLAPKAVVVEAGVTLDGSLKALVDHHFHKALAYFDHDYIVEGGLVDLGFFKPEFSRELLRSVDFVGGCFAVAINKIRLPSDNTCVAAEFCFSLWLENASKEVVEHIRHVAFHRSIKHPALAPSVRASKLLAFDRSSGVDSMVVADDHLGVCYTKYNSQQPLVSIIIPTRDHVADLRLCIESIQVKSTYPNYEIIVVDNQSTDPETLAYLDQIGATDRCKVLQFDEPFNYSRINNFGAEHSAGEIILLLNNDVEVISPDWIDIMVGQVLYENAGCVGAKLLYPDDTIQHAGVAMGPGGLAGHSHRFLPIDSVGYFSLAHASQQLSAVTAACLAVKKSVWAHVGGLDESFAVAYNDVDFCLRVQDAGYDNYYCANAQLYHYESKSRGKDDSPEKRARYSGEKQRLYTRWHHLIEEDPYYPWHLTHNYEDFSYRYDQYDVSRFSCGDRV